MTKAEWLQISHTQQLLADLNTTKIQLLQELANVSYSMDTHDKQVLATARFGGFLRAMDVMISAVKTLPEDKEQEQDEEDGKEEFSEDYAESE